MKNESLIYKGHEIRIVLNEDDEFFAGFCVKTIWFPDIDRVKGFIDRMISLQELNS